MFSFNKFALFLQMLELVEQAGQSEIATYIQEQFLPLLDPKLLNEDGGSEKLHAAVTKLAQKAQTMAQEAGGHEIENLQAIFKQSAQPYLKATNDRATVKALWAAMSRPSLAVSAAAIMILGAALAGSQYGPSKAQQVVGQAARQFGVNMPKAPPAAQPQDQQNQPQAEQPENYEDDPNGDGEMRQPPKVNMRRAMQTRESVEINEFSTSGEYRGDHGGEETTLDPRHIAQQWAKPGTQLQALATTGRVSSVKKLMQEIAAVTQMVTRARAYPEQNAALSELQHLDTWVRQQIASRKPVTEGNSLDLMHLPADAVAWLHDRPDAQVRAAKEVGVAASKAGNKIERGAVLRSDVNVLVLHDGAGKGKFHVYPDGSLSFNGEMIDGHEDVERCIGGAAEAHETPLDTASAHEEPVTPDPAVAVVVGDPEGEFAQIDQMEHYAEPMASDEGEVDEEGPEVMAGGIGAAFEALSWGDLDGSGAVIAEDDVPYFQPNTAPMPQPKTPHVGPEDTAPLNLAQFDLMSKAAKAKPGYPLDDAAGSYATVQKIAATLIKAHLLTIQVDNNVRYLMPTDQGARLLQQITARVNHKLTPMESLDWNDIAEGKTAEKFRALKQKVKKHNPRAKTPKLDHVIDMWSQVDEAIANDPAELQSVIGILQQARQEVAQAGGDTRRLDRALQMYMRAAQGGGQQQQPQQQAA